MSEFKAIIFDMNGVIIDDEHLHKQAEILTCIHFGLSVPETEWGNFRGRKSTEIFGHILDRYKMSGVSVSELVGHKVNQYFLLADEADLVPGALDFIRWSREKYQQVALATSGLQEIQKFIFTKFDLTHYFDFVITGDQVINGKPHPEIYLRAVNQLALPAKQCLVVEDSDNGIISSKAAGCFTLGLTTTFSEDILEQAGADKVFASFPEMKRYLLVE